jgi:VWFA-related protein
MRLAAVVAIALMAVAQAQQPPRFRAGVEVIQIDVSVVDRDRRPVRGLTAADFTVLEDGQPQDVVAFQHISVPGPDATVTGWLRDVAPDVRSNEPSTGRLLVMVLDDATLPPHSQTVQSARRVAREVIERLGPSDLAAVLFTRNNRNSQDFTSDRALLTRAVDKLSPGAIRSPSPMSASSSEPLRRSPETPLPATSASSSELARSVEAPVPGRRGSPDDHLWHLYSIETVRRAAEHLRDAPHARKTLIYVSVGIPVEFVPTGDGTTEETPVTGGTSDLQRDLARETQRAFVSALQANVTIYAVDPEGLRPDDNRLSSEFLRTIAENTGGFAVVNRNAPEAGAAVLMQETASYYLLGFQSSTLRADGRFRRITVRVNRPDVTVRARRGYYAPRAQPGRVRTNAASPLPLDAAIGGLLPTGDLPMHVAVAPFAAPGKREGALAIVIRLPRSVEPSPTDQAVELLTALFDTEGKVRASLTQTAHVSVRPEGEGAPYELWSRLDVKPGRYVVRVAAHDAGLGKAGSVYHDVEVPDFWNAPVSLSGMVLSATPALHAEPGDALAAVMPIVPTTVREFARSATVRAFVRVYQAGGRRLAPIELRSRIRNAEEREVFSRRETFAAEAFAGVHSADYQLDLPMPELAPGPHLLTIEARRDRAVVRRDVRFLVR